MQATTKFLTASALTALCSLILKIGWPSDYTMAIAQLSISVLLVCLAVKLYELKLPAPAFSCTFGAISYPLYLIHPMCYLIARGIIKRTGAWMFAPLVVEILLATILSLFAAFVLNELVNLMNRAPRIRLITQELASR
jgi:peptidoglycan/LPS O-acetylase OafA/YrhL